MARTRQPGIEFSGPFFTKDPVLTFRENARKMLEGMAAEGEAAVRAASPYDTGAFRGGVVGRTKSLSGRKWAMTAVISQQHVYRWPNAGSKEYRGGKLEARLHMFRRVTSALRRSRAVAVADLTKGMN